MKNIKNISRVFNVYSIIVCMTTFDINLLTAPNWPSLQLQNNCIIINKNNNNTDCVNTKSVAVMGYVSDRQWFRGTYFDQRKLVNNYYNFLTFYFCLYRSNCQCNTDLPQRIRQLVRPWINRKFHYTRSFIRKFTILLHS